MSKQLAAALTLALTAGLAMSNHVGAGVDVDDANADPSAPATQNEQRPPYRTQSYAGRVVWLAEVLERRFGIETLPEARERILALETDNGELIPLVEDLRGRSFRTDERLRKMHVELRIRRYLGSPAGQVVRIYEIGDQGKFLVDYWCDVCAIAMYEQGLCACCQAENRLRKRAVNEAGEPDRE